MSLPLGIRHIRPNRLAFRRDYCRNCEEVVVAERVRTWVQLTFFWIPLLPIGFWRRWRCSTCSRTPHRLPRVGRGIKILVVGFCAAGVLSALTVGRWYEEPGSATQVGVIYGVGLLLSAVWLIRHRSIPPRSAGLAILSESGEEPFRHCPFCGEELRLKRLRPYCSACDVVELPLAENRSLSRRV